MLLLQLVFKSNVIIIVVLTFSKISVLKYLVIVGIIVPSELTFFVCKPTLHKTSYFLYVLALSWA